MDFKKAGCLGLMAYSEAFERDFPVKKTKAVQSIATLNSPGAAGSLLGGNLISTARGMSRQDKRDVNASVRYAQWFASQERDRQTDPQGWFSLFAITLWSMGWEYEKERVVEEYYRQFSGQLSQAYLNVISGVNSQMAKVTSDMFGALLANTSALWSLSKGSLRGKEFAIAPAQYDSQGRLSLGLNDYSLRARVQREDFLFWDWKESNVTLTHRAVPFTLNRARFEEVRPTLNDRLDIVADAIFEFYSEHL
ncbi:hypothetical protein J2Y86_004136 [Pseudomonas migulae]|uniref:hypothetical protein n=1 Tax=Pseudomonas migulae TaxID=78543 RepID=UPI00209D6741|nr:hypothetical protein [Pseudomonas migulae]MCP1499429.1 hypothetical protein [Pseudomonas migulae]